MSDRQAIIDGMARLYYVQAWANYQDERADKGYKPENPGAGGDWYDIAPKTARWAERYARKVAAWIERVNGCTLDALYDRAVQAIEAGGKVYTNREPDEDRFGADLAHESMGTGVRWTDNYPDFPYVMPTHYLEVYIGYQSPIPEK